MSRGARSVFNTAQVSRWSLKAMCRWDIQSWRSPASWATTRTKCRSIGRGRRSLSTQPHVCMVARGNVPCCQCSANTCERGRVTTNRMCTDVGVCHVRHLVSLHQACNRGTLAYCLDGRYQMGGTKVFWSDK